jgi:hypothetical protein
MTAAVRQARFRERQRDNIVLAIEVKFPIMDHKAKNPQLQASR